MEEALVVMGELILVVLAAAGLAAVLWTFPSLFMAASHNGLLRLLRPCFQAFLNAAKTIFRALDRLFGWLTAQIASALEAVDYRRPDLRGDDWATHWRLIGPLTYLVLLVVMASGAIYVGTLRIGVLLGLEESALEGAPVPVDVALTLAWVLAGGLLGLVYLDSVGATSFRLPWENLHEDRRRWVTRIALAGVVVAALGTAAEFAWGDLQTKRFGGAPLPAGVDILLPQLLWLAMALTMAGAVALTLWSLPKSVIFLWLLPLIAGVFVAWPLREGTRLAVAALPPGYYAACAAVTFIAWWGRSFWNWLCRFSLTDRLHLRPIEFEEPEPLEPEEPALEQLEGFAALASRRQDGALPLTTPISARGKPTKGDRQRKMTRRRNRHST